MGRQIQTDVFGQTRLSQGAGHSDQKPGKVRLQPTQQGKQNTELQTRVK